MFFGMGFFKSTVIGGAFFLVPLVVIAVIIGKALGFMRKLAMLFSGIFEIDSVNDVLFLDILSVIVLVLVCYLAGLVARTRAAVRLVQWLEEGLLNKIPLYLFFKSLAGGGPSHEADHTLIPVWVRLDDFSQLAFETKRQEDGQVVVFFPGAPNPWSGALGLADPERVTPAEMTMVQAIAYQSRLGSVEARAKKLAPDTP
ncbi:DUF502 domain-containing protein [Novosphingobium mangrovi (ex Hu et al. 2023)]|uniref:DUF502 domain-containing protein n=1 Tax=Novosphingobium mangrovi (ex Hu et al. 2023) TaxID=2930094 RepID=A0ABT0A7I5_9SPHN|nr:DUF502 domain-containing protein [Novosphingobium mangrovi (ex Hu et al. 2023)]MCJ1959160.1 DUF502 domain-containing protein [Novosphingobium mangrovi (ex Hu et al. 2023)]